MFFKWFFNIILVIKSRRIKSGGGHVACIGDWVGTYRFLVGTPPEKKTNCEDNIKMNFQEVGWGRHGLD
jgi:hypothetical protein